ncbi:MAG: hypothetical protein ABIQ99_16760 [Thermoflexales bacterium]
MANRVDRSLEHLELRANALTAVPDGLAGLPRPRKLDLLWNRLRAAPDSLVALARRGCLVYI